MCAATQQPTWLEAFEENELGGLLGVAFRDAIGHSAGGFFLFVLVISVVANSEPHSSTSLVLIWEQRELTLRFDAFSLSDIINVYSMGLSISVISTFIARLPRIIWPIIITGIYVPVAIVGANS